MTIREDLPATVLDLIDCGMFAEYATVSAAGVPIDTPVLYFPSADLRSFDLATGVAYPAKAERARRNPKVGLLLEGGPDAPVISVAGMAAVRDRDLQGNVDRYLSEAAHTLPHNPDWSLARQAVWYWTRILVEITPVRVLWWDAPSRMDGAPRRWDAPAGTIFPQSDPAPPGKASEAAKWREGPWAELAGQALARGAAGHLSVIDADGYPLPIRARSLAATEDGFLLDLPRGVPGALEGKACLTFGGVETFIGEAAWANGRVSMRVERALPVFPMTEDMVQLWNPAPATREQLMHRLRQETDRRGQPIPMIPDQRPEPSEGYRRRLERRKASAATN
jgi:hypothetical protein